MSDASHGIYSVRAPVVRSSGGGPVIFNPYADMHDPVECSVEWFTKNNYQVRGVVHIGANDGKELAWYITKNYRPILAFEPHPDAFAELKRRYGNHAILMNFALGNASGSIDLLVPDDGDTEKTSKYHAVPTEGHEWTKISSTKVIKSRVATFEMWAGVHTFNLQSFNTLVVDVQGMELEVLEGMGRYIHCFDNLVIECSKVPVYDGESDAQTVVDWLGERGFAAKTPIEEHNDIFFVKENGEG